MSDIKPQEIDAIKLDKFELMVDNIVTTLSETKTGVSVEKVEELESAATLLDSGGSNGLSLLPIIGETVGPMMVLNYNTQTNKYMAVYSNATVAAATVGLNPTTIRQRCKDNKVIDFIQWGYITSEEYQTLKG